MANVEIVGAARVAPNGKDLSVKPSISDLTLSFSTTEQSAARASLVAWHEEWRGGGWHEPHRYPHYPHYPRYPFPRRDGPIIVLPFPGSSTWGFHRCGPDEQFYAPEVRRDRFGALWCRDY